MAPAASSTRTATRTSPRTLTRRLLASGVLFGVGLAAFVDEAVFHQLLHWHHFYDQATTRAGLVSDGLFHAFGWFAVVAGLFLFADVRRRGGPGAARWWPAVLIGAGAFQLFDGTVNHKLLRVHQIRYETLPVTTPGPGPYEPVDNLVVYDAVWIGVAVLLLAAGGWLWHRGSRRQRTEQHAPA